MRQTLTITNKLGLHARAAARLVKHAKRYISKIKLRANDKTVPAKSIMGVMLLAAKKGSKIELIVDGPDEVAAMQDLAEFINNKFDEEE